jgi:hypothetical protein
VHEQGRAAVLGWQQTVNATRHPLGVRGTFTPAQVAERLGLGTG